MADSKEAWERKLQRDALNSLQRSLGTSKALHDVLEDLWNNPEEDRTGSGMASRLYPGLRDQDSAALQSRVRTHINHLKPTIALFEATPEGRRARYKISIGNRPYELKFDRNAMCVKRFWSPHSVQEPTTIICTAPLFVRDLDRRILIRQLDLNEASRLDRRIRKWLSKMDLTGLSLTESQSPAFIATLSELLLRDFAVRRPYAPLGELKCTFALSRGLDNMGIPIEHGLAHELEQGSPRNCILLGNARTNHLLFAHQKRCRAKFMMLKNMIYARDHRHRPSEGADHGRFVDKVIPGGYIFAVVSRFVNDGTGAVTVLGANHSWASAKLGEILVDDREVERLLKEAGFSDWGELPTTFEIVLQMFFGQEGTESIVSWRVVTTRGLSEAVTTKTERTETLPRTARRFQKAHLTPNKKDRRKRR